MCPLRNAIEAALDGGTSLRGVELSLDLFRDGEPAVVWLRVGAQPMVMDGRPHVTVALDDITDRRLAELALRESEERYRAMFEKNRAVKLLIEPETGALVDASPAAVDFYGYPHDQLCALNISDLNTLPPAELREALQQALRSEVTSFVFRHRLASGEVRDVEVNTGPMEAAGRPLLFSIVHDITERIEAETALAASEERFRRLAERVLGFVTIKDSDRRYLYLSSLRGAKVSGGEEAWLGKLPEEVWYDDEAHHERLDGSGYPQGLTPQDLLQETRILAVADVVEAMSSHRPYRAALGRDAALAEIRDGAGTRYDADVVAACERAMEEGGFRFSP